jgi:hypothetical protein
MDRSNKTSRRTPRAGGSTPSHSRGNQSLVKTFLNHEPEINWLSQSKDNIEAIQGNMQYLSEWQTRHCYHILNGCKRMSGCYAARHILIFDGSLEGLKFHIIKLEKLIKAQ